MDNRLVLDMSPHYGRRDHYALIRRKLPRPEFLDATALTLTGIGPGNHYHWLLDILPRFEVARLSALNWDCVIGPKNSPVHHACYDRLGIDPIKIVATPYDRQLIVREVVASSFPSLRYSPSPFAVEFLRELFADCLQPDSSSPRRIYISRTSCKHRRVHNETDVEGMLSTLGFETVLLEALTIDQQARLFSNVDYIVAPHGAGLANCAFCRPGTQLIEIFSKDYTPGFFRRLAAVCGLRYRCMIEDNARRGREDVGQLCQDMHIDVLQLKRLLAF